MDYVMIVYWKHFSLPGVSMTISICNKAMRSKGKGFLTIPINENASDEGLHLPIVCAKDVKHCVDFKAAKKL